MALLGLLDYITGFELSFALFYLLPVSLAAWYLGHTAGIVSSFLSALIWLFSNILAGQSYSHHLLPYWNAFTRVVFFAIEMKRVEFSISRIQKALLQTTDTQNWPITFSIGIISFYQTPPSTDEIINLVDQLMYQVKNTGKNNIAYAKFKGKDFVEHLLK